MAFVRAFMKGTIHMNHLQYGGFEESFELPTTDYATGKASLQKIVNYRRALLPADIEIVHANCSRTDRDGDSARIGGLPLGQIQLNGEDPGEDCHTPESGYLYRFDTGSGVWRNYLIRGLRDSWIEHNRKKVSGADYVSSFAPEPTLPDGTSSTFDALKAFLQIVAATTRIHVPGTYQIEPAPADPEPGFDVLEITRVQFRKIGSRDVGRGFSRRKRRRKKAV